MKIDFIYKAFIALFGLFVILFLLFTLTGTVLPENSYTVEIAGLSGLAVNGTATVMVPVPANATGALVIPGEVLAGDQVTGWQAAVRETPYGRMLAFTATEDYPPDISLSFEVVQTEDKQLRRLPRHIRPINQTAWEMKREPRLLMPVLATPDTMSVAEFIQGSGGTYTTAVFLDGFVPPAKDVAGVTFSLEYRGVGGTERLMRENTWVTTVNTVVMDTGSGFVPVPADYQVIAGGLAFL